MSGNDFEVLVFVNGVEMSSLGAGMGMGMDPYDVFVPFNRLRPRAEPFEVPSVSQQSRKFCESYTQLM